MTALLRLLIFDVQTVGELIVFYSQVDDVTDRKSEQSQENQKPSSSSDRTSKATDDFETRKRRVHEQEPESSDLVGEPSREHSIVTANALCNSSEKF